MHRFEPLSIRNTRSWQSELADAITSVDELLRELELEQPAHACLHDSSFRLLVPRSFVNKMRKRDVNDPLLRQVLPLTAENCKDGAADPVGDLDAMAAPGVLHKYRGRVLLVTTGACAVHCRYCFRRHFPYADSNPCRQAWQDALEYVKARQDIREVILSGGDPLMLGNARLERLFDALEAIHHVEWLRIHSRMPVVLPSRIDDGLIELLQRSRFRITLVIHANHANELTADEFDALQRLDACGITLLNQSVLLKGVNDSATALVDLSRKLFATGTLPYYLHTLDPVQGAMHFNVPRDRAVALIESVRAELPGYLVPRLVREIPGESSKTAIFTI